MATPRFSWKTLRRLALWLLISFLLLSSMPVLIFRWLPVPTSSVILQRTVQEWQWQHYDWTPWRQISPYAALAVIAAEDQKFPDHHGIDVDAINDAIEDRAEGKRLRGASTITQQVARNLFLWQGRSFVRKGLEVWYAGLLELFWPKQRILEVYLNIAETGPQTFGIGPASQRFLKQPAAQLSISQSALIAAVLPNPIERRIDQPSDTVRQRQRWIERQMRQLGGVTYLEKVVDH